MCLFFVWQFFIEINMKAAFLKETHRLDLKTSLDITVQWIFSFFKVLLCVISFNYKHGDMSFNK